MGGSSSSRNETSTSNQDNREFFYFTDSSDRSVRQEYDYDIDNSIGSGSIVASDNAVIHTLDADVVSDAFNFSERVTGDGFDALERSNELAYKLANNVAERSLQTSSSALTTAFSNTIAGQQEQNVKMVGLIAVAAVGAMAFARAA